MMQSVAEQSGNAVAAVQQAGMGQIKRADGDNIVRAILGSCVGVAIYCRKRSVGMLAHIVLPDAAGRGGPEGKFVDTAIPWMIEQLKAEGIVGVDLEAKLAGGANMFNSTGPLQIGDKNVQAAKAALEQHRIPLVAEDCGGECGRRVTFHAGNGTLQVEIAGEQSVVL